MELKKFDFKGNDVRVTIGADGEPRWVASDVSKVLGIGRTHDMIRNLDDDEKGASTIRTLGGDQEVTVITESGLYSAILRSRKPEAKEFKRWVEYGFVAGQDYTDKNVRVERDGRGAVEATDHIITLDMAKEISMIQRTAKGKQARQYFIAA